MLSLHFVLVTLYMQFAVIIIEQDNRVGDAKYNI